MSSERAAHHNSVNVNRAITALQVQFVGFLLFALVWWTGVHASIDAPARWLLDLLSWPLDGSHQFLSGDVRWLSGVGAGLLVGMSLFMLLVVLPELRAGNFRVLKGAIRALLGWFVFDSFGSVVAGVASNAWFNVAFFLPTLALLLYLQRRSNHR